MLVKLQTDTQQATQRTQMKLVDKINVNMTAPFLLNNNKTSKYNIY